MKITISIYLGGLAQSVGRSKCVLIALHKMCSRCYVTIAALTMMNATVLDCNADIAFYDDKTQFLSTTGATLTAGISSAPEMTYPALMPITVGAMDFGLALDSSRFVIGDWSFRWPGNELAISGSENLNVTLVSGKMNAFGFEFVEPERDGLLSIDPTPETFVDSVFDVVLMNGGAVVSIFQFERDNDSAEFVGVVTSPSLPFNEVLIRELNGDEENEFFGNFYAGLAGDTDGDGDIDDADLGTSFSNYTGPVGAAGGKTATDGDTDGDGDVDDIDLGTSFSAYSGPLSPTNVPEPASITVLIMGSLITSRRRRG